MSADIEIWNAGACHACGQPSRDRAAHRRELLDLDLSGRSGSRRRGRGCCTRLGPLDVLGHDAPFRARPGERRQVDPALAGDAARQRRGLDPAAVSRRAGCRGASAVEASSALASSSRAWPGEPSSFESSSTCWAAEPLPLTSTATSSPSSPMTAIVWPTGTSPS